jgi:predicted metal-dependent phosphoesterase TrpH
MVDREAAAQQAQLSPDGRREIAAQGAILSDEAGPQPGLMKVDLHCHSEASADCVTPIPLMPERCLERDIRVQAITDHNEIWGAQKLRDLVAAEQLPLTIIVGEEVSTREGEIVGLFLEEKIEAGLSPEETVARILEQGGLVLLPHGFDPLKRFR